MDVNIIPTYSCSLKCDYCFLGNLFDNTQCIDLSKLYDQMVDISRAYNIDRVDLFGGELSVYHQLDELIRLVKQFSTNISLATNCQNPDILRYVDDVDISISLNPTRNDFKRNIKLINSLSDNVRSKIYISTVVLPDLLCRDCEQYLNMIDRLNVKSLFFLQYYKPKYGKVKYDISNNRFVDYMKNVIDVYSKHNYSFNLENINSCRNRTDPHISNYMFINPYNQYGCTSYENGEESFVWVNDLESYDKLIRKEKLEYLAKCGLCKHYMSCLAEHLHEHEENDQCCGLPELMSYVDKYL